MRFSSPTTKRSLQHKTSTRRGLATLEFVMSLPFLLFLAAMTASLGWAALKKADTTMTVRNAVWKMRSNPETTDAALSSSTYKEVKPLEVASGWDQGRLYGEAENTFRVFWQRNNSRSAKSGTALLRGTWDYTDLDDFDSDGPHFSLLARLAGKDAPILNSLGVLVGAGFGAAVGSSDEINAVNQQMADTQAEQQAQEEEMQNTINELKEELRILEEELAALQAEYRALLDQQSDLVDRRDAAEDRLSDLKTKLANLDPDEPVPPGLVEEIEKLEGDIEKLEEDIDKIKGKIDEKQKEVEAKRLEVEAKREEVEGWEDAQDQAGDKVDELP